MDQFLSTYWPHIAWLGLVPGIAIIYLCYKYLRVPKVECRGYFSSIHVWLYPPERDRRCCKFCARKQIRGYRNPDDKDKFYNSVWVLKPYKHSISFEQIRLQWQP